MPICNYVNINISIIRRGAPQSVVILLVQPKLATYTLTCMCTSICEYHFMEYFYFFSRVFRPEL